MPVDFQIMHNEIKSKIGSQASERQTRLNSLAEQARALMNAYAQELDVLEARVEQAVAQNSSLRCARPAGETLTQAFPAPDCAAPDVILAADGSQINPDRHSPFQFGVINVGAIRILPGQNVAPTQMVESKLLCYDELETPQGPIGEEIVALMRDLGERRMLAELSREEQGRVVTLTDGPLELFREPNSQSSYQSLLPDYLNALQELAEMGVATAGYVDRPQGDLVVRLLELFHPDNPSLEYAWTKRPFRFVNDLALFTPLLGPGERSAVFGIQSVSARKFSGVTALHFFYLNTGFAHAPSIARVEIPQWVACNAAMVDLVHAALVDQCRQLGSVPYPYALHRAHEVAVVSLDEKQQLLDLILRELRMRGLAVDSYTQKQTLKNTTGSRTRYSL